MKNCKDCNEFACGFSNTDNVSPHCGVVHPVIEQVIKPFAPPSPCFKCLTIENGVCLIGSGCYNYTEQNVRTEVIRRKRAQADRLQKEYERLMKEIERLSE